MENGNVTKCEALGMIILVKLNKAMKERGRELNTCHGYYFSFSTKKEAS